MIMLKAFWLLFLLTKSLHYYFHFTWYLYSTGLFLGNSFSSHSHSSQSSKSRELHGNIGWVGQIFTWVTWVYIHFMWVIPFTWVAWVKYTFAWVKLFCVHQKIFAWV